MKKFIYKGKEWEYIPVKEQRSKNITHNKIIGDVFDRSNQNPISVLTVENRDGKKQTARVYPYKEKLSFTETVVGYIPENALEGTYVRIVKNSIAKLLIPIVLIILIIMGGLFAWYSQQSKVPGLDKTAIAYQMPNGAKNDDPSRIMMPFFDVINVTKDGQGQMVLLNPDGNECYFKYILTLTDENKKIYESGLIKPGMAVTEWKLNENLEAGEYNATLQIETSDINDYTQKANGGNYVVKVVVEE